MAKKKISKITPEQEALIPVYCEKWRKIALSTEPIDPQKARDAIRNTYLMYGLNQPEVLFFPSLYAACSDDLNVLKSSPSLRRIIKLHKALTRFSFWLVDKPLDIFPTSSSKLGSSLRNGFKGVVPAPVSLLIKAFYWLSLLLIFFWLILSLLIGISLFHFFKNLYSYCKLEQLINNRIGVFFGTHYIQKNSELLQRNVENEFDEAWLYRGEFDLALFRQLRAARAAIVRQVSLDLETTMNHWLFLLKVFQEKGFYDIDKHLVPLSEQYSEKVCYLDYCFSALGCTCRELDWQALRNLVQECGWWIMPFEKLCIVCDRPRILEFDSENRLHAEGKPAIQFADGYSLYSYHGVTLPEKYGNIHPNQWQPKWILEEKNAELRRALIQGIGYARICQELQAVALDSWREYTLLKIEAEADGEPIVLLKMTCPSTHHIHALRVPPDVTSAREAVRWVNHGIDPEEFAIET